jgi:predicted NAD-dependent protein-ADP-ribosyltransferase YbiA (DUF1768 family)
MVSSRINPRINYTEKKTLDPEDLGHSSTLYVIEVFDISVVIVLGKQKYTHSSKEVIYYPIYIVADDKIKSQIGVFEAKLSNTLNLVDEDGDIDIEKMGEPLLYSFVTKKYILKSNTNPKKYLDKSPVEQPDKKEVEVVSIGDDDENLKEEDSDEMDVMKLKVPAEKISREKQKTDEVIEQGIFTIDKQFRQPPLLKEETESDADKEKLQYRESSSNQWIEKFMKNNNYNIVEVEAQGDCFFAVLREAFAQIGQKTNVGKLRALLASRLTDDVYSESRKFYEEFETQKTELRATLKELKDANAVYAKRMKTTTDKAERESIVEETKKIKSMYSSKMAELKETDKLQNDYIGFMKDIDTLEKYRSYILTSSFWADSWAISTLEVALKIKVIIFSEEAYKKKDFDGVLNCGEINKSLIKKDDYSSNKDFDPNYYILATYSGNHYRLITYKRKNILTFNEIPYDVKILILNKCLEKNSGIYYLIQDFRNFKTLLGLDPDEGKPDDDDSDDELNTHLYDKDVIFTFHSKSLDSQKPGDAAGEQINKDKRIEFSSLLKIPNWKKKLDDSWNEAPFSVDGHRWASVEHYIQGSKFKKMFPDFYSQFSLDVPSDLSTDVELAKMVGDTSKTKHKNLRPKNVKVDTDFNLGRDILERETAVQAKFSQNEDLKQLLLATRKALLKKYIRRKPAEPDIILMKVRDELK